MEQIFNFSSGPAMLPVDVIKLAQKELCNWRNLGVSVMEISHRSKEFIQIVKETKKNFRDLLNIPSNYKVLFCHGGGRGQFSALPLNLLDDKKRADYVESGYWSSNAIKEARKYCTPNVINVRVVADGKYGIKPMSEWKLSDNAAYMHYCPNETVDGIAIYETPSFSSDIIVTADFSSVILSSPINIRKFGIIYASAQKNIGPAGLALVIIRDDLLGRTSKTCPSILNYTIINDHDSMFNTPPTFIWYMAGLVFQWLKRKGGVSVIYSINQKKAELLYKVIDSSNFYHNNIINSNRSYMNVPFSLPSKKLDKLFLEESFSAGLLFLKGHRFVGGIRAAIYNAMPMEGVKVLTDFMIDFERRHG